jgi:hypothetical protein
MWFVLSWGGLLCLPILPRQDGGLNSKDQLTAEQRIRWSTGDLLFTVKTWRRAETRITGWPVPADGTPCGQAQGFRNHLSSPEQQAL